MKEFLQHHMREADTSQTCTSRVLTKLLSFPQSGTLMASVIFRPNHQKVFNQPLFHVSERSKSRMQLISKPIYNPFVNNTV